MITREQFIAAHSLAAYLYGTSGEQFAQDIFPGQHPSYQHEKMTMWGRSPIKAIGLLDEKHFARLVEIAIDRHGDNARQYADLARAAL